MTETATTDAVSTAVPPIATPTRSATRSSRTRCPFHARAARGRPGRAPVALRRLRHGPLRAGARRARRLAGLPVRRRASGCRTSAPRSRGGRRACCWRPTRPTTTPRAGCCRAILGPRALRRLRETWAAAAEDLVDQVLAARDAEFDAVPALAEAFPLRVFPDAVGIPAEGRENLLPYGDLLFNAFGPRNDLVADGRAPGRRAVGLGERASARARCSTDGRLRRRRSGPPPTAATSPPSRRRWSSGRCCRPASTPPCTASAAVLLRLRHPPRAVAAAARAARRWRGSRSTRRCAGSRRCRRSSAPPPPTSASATPSSRTGRRS